MNIVCIDLEGVLIDSWENRAILYNKKKQIREILTTIGTNTCDLFSYAVDNMTDYVSFMKFAHQLELAFDIEFNEVFTVLEIMDMSRTEKMMWEFKMDGKRDGFIEFIRQKKLDNNTLYSFYLIDDNVQNEVVELKSNVTITFIRVE